MSVRIKAIKGTRYHRLTIIREVDFKISGGQKRRQVLCKCSCGSPAKVIEFSAVRSGKTKSCGCLGTESTRKSKTIHGDYEERIYKYCYRKMLQRSKERLEKGESCKVYKPWKDNYLVFKKWALSNGYQDNLILCRNNDKGDYSPDNCRFATRQENSEEALAKYWQVKSISDEEWEIVYNLATFCKKNNLSQSAMSRVAYGNQIQHKGFLCKPHKVP